ncbi:caspase family protein [Reichenbachiella sp. MALMAid0571]|uniref:caspase family protein n=1 Tax=Reichenbachiella sp. MALMAid0571 TaxID=3143939 RepID=UPI0032DF95CA
MLRQLLLTLLFSSVIFISTAQDVELVVRQGHKSAINMVAYSPTGKHIYSASEDKSIKMWDVATGIDVNTFNAHEAGVNCIYLSKDGKTLLSGDKNGKMILWNALTGEILLTIDGHEGGVNTAKLSADGQMIVSGGEDELLKLWTAKGDTIKTIRGFSAPIKNLAISPDGDRIVTGGGKNNSPEVKLIDPDKGVILADALDSYKGSGAALAYTKVIMTGFAVIGNVANGRIGKDMTTIFIMSYSNIEFTDDGKKVLFSQNIYIPFIASKGEEEDTGNASAMIAALTEDRNAFAPLNRPNQWQLANSRGVAVYNQDQTKIIVNETRSIKVYDVENAEFPEPGNKEATKYVPPVVKEIKNITKNTNWLSLSPDYRTVVTSDVERKMKLFDFESGRKIRDLEGYVQPALAVDVLPDGRHILVGSADKNMTMWDITSGQMVRSFERTPNVNSIDISKNGKSIATTEENSLYLKVWNITSGRVTKTLMEKKDNMDWIKFDPDDDDKVWAHTTSGDTKEWSLSSRKDKKMKEEYTSLEDKFKRGDLSVSFDGYDLSVKKGGSELFTDTQKGVITDAVFSIDSKFLITTNEGGEIAMYDLNTRKRAITMALIDEADNIAFTPDFYYTSSKGAAKAIAFKTGNKVLPVEQLELKYNRPDIVANRIGYAPQKLVASYKAAYERRLKRLGFKESDLGNNFDLPTVTVDAGKLPLETDQRSISFSIKAQDKDSNIDRLNVYVNDVPVFSSSGIDVSAQSSKVVSKDVTFDLSAGLNEIKVTALNAKGQESIPEFFEIQYSAEWDKPDLYLVGVGVSEYQQSNYNLAFAAKDANDIANTLKKSSAYGNVNVKMVTNANATDSNIKAIRSFVEKAKVDDVVMIFIAGHGVLDNDYNYYFATHNIDFSNPANGGLPYGELEKIIDGINCRNKVLMMDTCHSGELDDDDVEEATAQTKAVGSVAFRSAGALVKLKENSFGLENTLELSKALFGDMKKGTGATVISAAGGTEFAAEGVNSANGLFTASFIEGIKTRYADWNRDASYTVSEMRNFVSEQVIKKSNGNQVPTSREENVKNDFRLY